MKAEVVVVFRSEFFRSVRVSIKIPIYVRRRRVDSELLFCVITVITSALLSSAYLSQVSEFLEPESVAGDNGGSSK